MLKYKILDEKYKLMIPNLCAMNSDITLKYTTIFTRIFFFLYLAYH